ncbi:NYN domain-containing protein [Pholiota molesta]|nr:NYN domain-containing protein [Pholiota molesta]
MTRRYNKGPPDIAIFWDYENCPVPSNVRGSKVVSSIFKSVKEHGNVFSFKAYLRITEEQLSNKAIGIRSQLQYSGVSLIDCPLNGKKDVVDHMMMVDMIVYAMSHPDSTIVVITGDRDFAYALATMKLQGHKIVLITKSNAHASIKEPADICLDWDVGFNEAYDDAEEDVENESEDDYDDYSSDSDHILEDAEIDDATSSAMVRNVVSGLVTPPHSPSKTVGHYLDWSPKSPTENARHSPSMPNISDLALSSPIFKGRSKYETVVDLPLPKFSDNSGCNYSIFKVLIECLREHAANGRYRPLRSMVGSQISRNGATYRTADVRGFTEYTALAEKEGVVSLGGMNGLAWISLKPAWR